MLGTLLLSRRPGIVAIQFPMALQVVANQHLQFLALGFQLLERSRPPFYRIARQLAAVDGEELVAQQALLMTHQQDLLKHGFDLGRETADKAGDGGDVRHGIAGQGLENDVALAASFNLAAGRNAFGIGKQDDLEQDSGIVSRATIVVVAVLGIEH